MISLFVFIFSFLIAAFILGIFKRSTYWGTGKFNVSAMIRPIIAVVISFVIVMINPVDVERIDAGHVGIKVSNVGNPCDPWQDRWTNTMVVNE